MKKETEIKITFSTKISDNIGVEIGVETVEIINFKILGDNLSNLSNLSAKEKIFAFYLVANSIMAAVDYVMEEKGYYVMEEKGVPVMIKRKAEI